MRRPGTWSPTSRTSSWCTAPSSSRSSQCAARRPTRSGAAPPFSRAGDHRRWLPRRPAPVAPRPRDIGRTQPAFRLLRLHLPPTVGRGHPRGRPQWRAGPPRLRRPGRAERPACAGSPAHRRPDGDRCPPDRPHLRGWRRLAAGLPVARQPATLRSPARGTGDGAHHSRSTHRAPRRHHRYPARRRRGHLTGRATGRVPFVGGGLPQPRAADSAGRDGADPVAHPAPPLPLRRVAHRDARTPHSPLPFAQLDLTPGDGRGPPRPGRLAAAPPGGHAPPREVVALVAYSEGPHGASRRAGTRTPSSVTMEADPTADRPNLSRMASMAAVASCHDCSRDVALCVPSSRSSPRSKDS